MADEAGYDGCDCHLNGGHPKPQQLTRQRLSSRWQSKKSCLYSFYRAFLAAFIVGSLVFIDVQFGTNLVTKSAVQASVAPKVNDTYMCTHQKLFKGLSVRVCRESVSAPFSLVINVDGNALPFPVADAKRLMEWIHYCDPKNLKLSYCELPDHGMEGSTCRRRSIFTRGSWMCFNHDYSFESMTLYNHNLSYAKALKLVDYLNELL